MKLLLGIAGALALLCLAACAAVLTLHAVNLLDAWATVPARLPIKLF